MFILSQDKKVIINFNNFETIDLDPNSDYKSLDIDNFTIGTYATEERAKEVLYTIFKKLDVGERVYELPKE